MNRICFIPSLFFLIFSMNVCFSDKQIPITEIPPPAQAFIKKNFSELTIAYAKIDSGLMNKSYKVTFTNGSSVKFDEMGNWKDVECKHSAVPTTIIPKPIADYIAKHYKDVKVLSIERSKKKYKVDLSNKLELTFNPQFKLTHIKD